MKKLWKSFVTFMRECFAQKPTIVMQDMVGNTTILIDDDTQVCWPYGG
jgi:hypothetical protein